MVVKQRCEDNREGAVRQWAVTEIRNTENPLLPSTVG